MKQEIIEITGREFNIIKKYLLPIARRNNELFAVGEDTLDFYVAVEQEKKEIKNLLLKFKKIYKVRLKA